MPLILHRSNRMEQLVSQLAAELDTPPADPFAEVPVVVGSRGMERWLRHQLATLSRHGIAAQVAFPFPRQAFDGAVQAALAGAEAAASDPYWQPTAAPDLWDPEVLSFRLVGAIRRRAAVGGARGDAQVDFSGPYAFLSGVFDPSVRAARMADLARPVGVRELTFATEVAACLDRLMRRRPEVAQAWLANQEVPAAQAWLAALLRDLSAEPVAQEAAELHPVSARAALERAVARGAPGLDGSLHVFGLSTLGVDDLRTLTTLARLGSLRVHLYILSPTQAWVGEDRSAREIHRERRRVEGATTPAPGRLRHLDDELREAEQLNPLLTDLGKPSRDLQQLLETAGDFPVVDAFVEPTGVAGSVLHTLQRDLLFASWVEPGERAALDESDRSLTFHPCHGALRQVEVLRELLLHAFAADPALSPRDVLVMTPDVATFAPLVEAVFAQRRGGAPAIPVHVADLGLRAVNPVADAVLTLLELASERFDVPRLLALLALDPVRRRFGMTAEDLEDVERMLAGAGARWGFDAADRAAAGQPDLHQNTFAFAFERVALGVLMLDEAAEVCSGEPSSASGAGRSGSAGAWPGRLTSALGAPLRRTALPGAGRGDDRLAAPWDATTLPGQRRFGQLYACVQAVRYHRDQLAAGPASATVWRARLGAVIRDLTETTAEAAWLTGRVSQELDRALAPADAAAFTSALELDAVRALLKGRFEIPRQGDRQITGAVTVCAMEPMRSVPFEVVALLGMDDGTYPRAERARAWDPLARTPQPGEHQRRDVDRHLLLEALLSARQRVLVLWTGHEVRTGEAKPPAVLVSELQDAIDRRFCAAGARATASTSLTFAGTLQPWSTAAFETAASSYRPSSAHSFDAALFAASATLREVHAGTRATAPAAVTLRRSTERPDGGVQLQGQETPDRSLDLDVLARALQKPQKRLLRDGFGLHLAAAKSPVLAREPLALNGLERWELRDAALAELAADWGTVEAATLPATGPRALEERWRAEGRLPVGVVGTQEVAEQVDQAQRLLDALSVQLHGLETTALRPFSVTASVAVPEAGEPQPWTVQGAHGFVTRLREHGGASVLVSLQAGADQPKRRLAPWLHLLASAASEAGRLAGGLVIVRKDSKSAAVWWLQTPPAAVARQLLAGLIALWRRAATEVVPLLPSTSPALAEALCKQLAEQPPATGWSALDASGRRAVRSAAMSAWSPFQAASDGDDPWVSAVTPQPDWVEVLPDPREPCAEAEDNAGAGDPDDPQGWVAAATQVWAPVMPGPWATKLGTGKATKFAARVDELLTGTEGGGA